MRRAVVLLVGLGLFLTQNTPAGCPADSVLDNCFMVHAQSQGQAEAILYPADSSAFPTISTFMDVFDTTGRFVSGLKPEQVNMVEDGQQLPLVSLSEMVVPLQLAVAINPGPSLGVRDKLGTPRFQAVLDALNAWAGRLPADTPDDMSLISLSGPIISHASARDWLVSLGTFDPVFENSTPNVQTLQIALQVVAVQPPRVGMKRAVFLITPHVDDPNISTEVQALIQVARQNRVRVFVWFTDTDLYTATDSASAFETLAIETGGAYFAATGLAPYPDPETYFAPLRRLYSLQYNSSVKTGGDHKLSVIVQGQAGVVQSADQTFSVDLQPPNPILVSPPLEIVRGPPPDDPYNAEMLLPAEQHIDIIIEFPDGHKRPLTRTTLYVDGQPVAQNTAAPFDQFNWDLSGYDVTAEHRISVEAVDSLNLSKASIELPITVTVIQPPHGLNAFFGRYRQLIVYAAVGLAGFVLVLILLLGPLRGVFGGRRLAPEAHGDPVTQSIPSALEATVPVQSMATTRKRRTLGTSPKPPVKVVDASAFLQPMSADPLAAPGEIFKPSAEPPIPLAARETTFGSDPALANFVLHDPSIEGRHARITHNDNGDFFVVDAGTIGGTWVNFEPVGQEAHLLRHGDVLHFGQRVFRFELKEPPAPLQPKVSKAPPQA